MMIIIGGAVGGGCVLLICVITLVSLCCRHTGKGELNGQYGQGGSARFFFSLPFTLHLCFGNNEPKKRYNFVHLITLSVLRWAFFSKVQGCLEMSTKFSLVLNTRR